MQKAWTSNIFTESYNLCDKDGDQVTHRNSFVFG